MPTYRIPIDPTYDRSHTATPSVQLPLTEGRWDLIKRAMALPEKMIRDRVLRSNYETPPELLDRPSVWDKLTKEDKGPF